MPSIVAVDGPAGSGKSTICRTASEQKGWIYVNTGSLYRALAIIADINGVGISDEDGLCQLIKSFDDTFRWELATGKVFYAGDEITAKLITPQASTNASSLAKLMKVRELLLPIQRRIVQSAGGRLALVDGRDIGTVVFPDAEVKVYMTAAIEERAKRRLTDLLKIASQRNIKVPTLEEVVLEIQARDSQDSTREHAPLTQAADAHVMDTTGFNFAENVERLIELVENHL